MPGQDFPLKKPVEKSEKVWKVIHKGCGKPDFPVLFHKGLWKAQDGYPQNGNAISSTTTYRVCLCRQNP